MSVGHGSNFLLNIGPDNHGLLPAADCKRLLELGERIRAAYGNPRAFDTPVRTENTYTLTHKEINAPDWYLPKEDRLINCVMIREDLTNGQSVKSFRIYGYLPMYKKKRILLFEGRTVGHKVLCRFGAIRCSKLEIELVDFDGTPELLDIQAFYAK